MFNKLMNYIKETRIEMRKVNWPSRAQTTRFTLIVIGVSLGIALILGGFDFIFQRLLQIFII